VAAAIPPRKWDRGILEALASLSPKGGPCPLHMVVSRLYASSPDLQPRVLERISAREGANAQHRAPPKKPTQLQTEPQITKDALFHINPARTVRWLEAQGLVRRPQRGLIELTEAGWAVLRASKKIRPRSK
jgi:hypothetical protein